MTLADTIAAYDKVCERAYHVIKAMKDAGLISGRWSVTTLEMIGSMKVSVGIEEYSCSGVETDTIVMPVHLFDNDANLVNLPPWIESMRVAKVAKAQADNERRKEQQRQADLVTLAHLQAKYPKENNA